MSVLRRALLRGSETIESVRAAEPGFDALYARVCAAGTDSKWWFGSQYEHEGGLALLQHPDEFTALCLLLRRHEPRATYLEIGSAGGGTCRFLHEEVGLGRVLAIDDGGHPRAAEQEENFAAIGGVVRHLGDSHAPAAAAFLAEHAPDRSIDIAFVDGDHSFRGVRQDVRMVLPHVRPGGLLILHDTRRCRGVEATWLALAARRGVRPLAELCGSEHPLGIGVARLG